MKVALAHHWLLHARGGERVLAQLARIFPEAPILTTLVDRAVPWPREMREALGRVRASPLQWALPLSGRFLRYLVPLMPLALRALAARLEGYDTLLVSDAGLAKCIPTPPGTRKLVYAHTPMRRLWQSDETLALEFPRLLSAPAQRLARRLRATDREAARRAHGWAANSETTRARLAAVYALAPERIRVVYPPVSILEQSAACAAAPGWAETPRTGLLVVSPMVRYKRDDLAVLAAARLRLPLTVVGEGPERQRLMRMAGPEAVFLGHVDDARLIELYGRSEALVFAAREDFGLVPVEAMALGCPVLAFRAGGATETVREDSGGLFFEEQTLESVMDGIRRILARRFDPRAVRASAERFSCAAFERGIRDWVGPH